MSISEKVRENRLRRVARRRGLHLSKARRRDPQALDFGTFTLTSATTGQVVFERVDRDSLERLLALAGSAS